ncbi:MAG: elongation factor P maturation arginine rhamnosyltransferase EarP [Casimicrobiaceae bacterium]
MAGSYPRWDVFCRIVDNFGDAGFCWRLARQLVSARHVHITLWIDDLSALAPIVPGIDVNAARQCVDGVEVARFDDAFDARGSQAAIEAFGCGLPARYLDSMVRDAPVWINLEYLSAEAWVDGVHGLPSPQPQRPLTRWFYFPGFTAATGGLLQGDDATYLASADPTPGPGGRALQVSLFCYPNRSLPALLDAWAAAAEPLRVLVPEGVATADFARWLGTPLPAAPARIERRALTIDVLPFVTQRAFDVRLRACDLNIVRGEDSFVRAQWAARPLVWQAYRQANDVQRVKIDAFLNRYLHAADARDANAVRSFWHAFDAGNGDAAAGAWPALRARLPSLQRHAARWAEHLAGLPELSASLATFVKMRYN